MHLIKQDRKNLERGGTYVVYSRTDGVVPLKTMTIDCTVIINYCIVIFLSLYFLIF